MSTIPLFAFPGAMEIVFVLLLIVLLFGAKKIPKVARSTGRAMGEFEKGKEKAETELQEMRESVEEEVGDDEHGVESREQQS